MLRAFRGDSDGVLDHRTSLKDDDAQGPPKGTSISPRIAIFLPRGVGLEESGLLNLPVSPGFMSHYSGSGGKSCGSGRMGLRRSTSGALRREGLRQGNGRQTRRGE